MAEKFSGLNPRAVLRKYGFYSILGLLGIRELIMPKGEYRVKMFYKNKEDEKETIKIFKLKKKV